MEPGHLRNAVAGGAGCVDPGSVSYTHLDVYKRQWRTDGATTGRAAYHADRFEKAAGGGTDLSADAAL